MPSDKNDLHNNDQLVKQGPLQPKNAKPKRTKLTVKGPVRKELPDNNDAFDATAEVLSSSNTETILSQLTSEASTISSAFLSQPATTQAPTVTHIITATIDHTTVEMATGHTIKTSPNTTQAVVLESNATTQAITSSEVSTIPSLPPTDTATTQAAVDTSVRATEGISTNEQSTVPPPVGSTATAENQSPIVSSAETGLRIDTDVAETNTLLPKAETSTTQASYLTAEGGTQGIETAETSEGTLAVVKTSEGTTQGGIRTSSGTAITTDPSAPEVTEMLPSDSSNDVRMIPGLVLL